MKPIRTALARAMWRKPGVALAALCALLAACNAQARPLAFHPDTLCAKTLPSPAPASTVQARVLDTGHGKIGYVRFGRGSPIVLVTGYRSTIAEWNVHFLAELARHHEVIVFDNRGVGASQTQATGYTARDLASDTAALMQGLGVERATVLGWSMGGIVAQQLAIEAPARVAKLVLLSSMPPGARAQPPSAEVMQALSGSGADHFARVMAVLFPASALQAAQACFVGAMFAPGGYHEPKIADDVARAQDALMTQWQHDDAAVQALARVNVPALVLVGTQDAVLVPRNSQALAHALPKATLVEIAAGGHAMMYQYPVQLGRRIDTFIAAGEHSAR
ncbi:alpha/beta fold hydrolase [Paraburkholderia acidisoli]|uniref:Alpha/beta fold hydrolase n=1 Tax=Paraburkholderia acidisoli TaxID=2571748 RepID=A0A7Z2GNN0_9BURK|nr:alpha/beta hydrolase [Paraburkholderia acidisoli]QGZ65127.1 alpha/beta fold hydrolase [Paraburkholderia acidisoli]